MELVVLVLLVLALVLFLVAAFAPAALARPALMPLGLAAWVLAELLGRAGSLHG